MQLTFLKGYPDYVGKRFIWAGYGNGPSSYVQVTATGGGDPIVLPRFDNYVDTCGGGISVSRTYLVRAIPVAVGNRPTFRLQWVVISTGNEVAAAVNLSTEQVQLYGFGGVY